MSGRDATPFWSRRLTGLVRAKRVPRHLVCAIRDKDFVTLDPDSGELHTYVLPAGLPVLIERCIDEKIKLLVTEHPGFRLLDHLCRTNAARAAMDAGYLVRPYESAHRTAAIVFAQSDDVETLEGDKVELWDIGTYYPSAPKDNDALVAVAATARRWHQLCTFCDEHYGTRPEMTPSRTGFTTWRLNWTGHMWRKPAAARRHGRKAFHGGYTRAFVTNQEVRHAKQFDINSAYPWAMKSGVPAGTPVWGEGQLDKRFPALPGIFYARVLLNPNSPGILLFRSPLAKQGPRTDAIEPATFGTYELWTTSQELELARAMGVVSEVLYGWVFPDGIDYAFTDAVNVFELARAAARDIGPQLEGAAKLIQNSTWGGMARKPTTDEVILCGDRPGDEWFPYVASSGMIAGAWTRAKDTDGDARQQIMAAAWITSTVRVFLVRTIIEIGVENVIYADTDSVVVRDNVTLETGGAYGQWKLVSTYSVYRAFGGKRYEGITVDGEQITKAAGVALEVLRSGVTLANLYHAPPLSETPTDAYNEDVQTSTPIRPARV